MKRILVAYDFSPHARRALALALSGVPFGTEVELDVIHVMDTSTGPRVERDAPLPTENALTDYFNAEIQRVTTPERRLLRDPKFSIVHGRPMHELLVRASKYDGIMIGGQGHGGLAETFLGTTAMHVARESPVSVYVAKKANTLSSPSRILCAVDSDDGSRRALTEAHSLCVSCSATLSLMRAILQPPNVIAWPSLVPHLTKQTAEAERATLITFEQQTLGRTFAKEHTVQISRGGIAADITHRAALDRADTIVVGARNDAFAKRLLGSVSESVIQQAGCDVYVVRRSRATIRTYWTLAGAR
jgi:nucleotide-binding universal stress UspA family protein